MTGDARALLLTQEDVPEGWEPRAVDEPAGFRAFPCGVDVEPAARERGRERTVIGRREGRGVD